MKSYNSVIITIFIISIFLISPVYSYERDFKTHPVIKKIQNAEKIVAISDIHGAIFQFIATLEEVGIVEKINKNKWIKEKEIFSINSSKDFKRFFTYTGGKTILVISGDLISRGYFSREVIDLVIFLENEARKHQGKVITIPGNHEVRILTGEIEKLQKYEKYEFVIRSFNRSGKYKDTSYRDMVSKDGFYGKWLRELPMAAIVNNIFFVHAGIAPGDDIERLMNAYRDSILEDNYESEVFDGDTSPMWIRKTGKKKSKTLWWKNEDDLLNILKNIKCKYMVVGHDPGALGKKGLIGVKYGRLFNIDVGMTPSKGYSMGGALIIDHLKNKTIFTALESNQRGFFHRRIIHENLNQDM